MSASPFTPPDTTYADIGLLLAEAQGLRSRVSGQWRCASSRDDGSDVDVTALAQFLAAALRAADCLLDDLHAAQGHARHPIPRRTLRQPSS
jgi:hypothetical protein